MADIKDVARYILSLKGPMTAMKLQKLAYYSQSWHLVWADSPLFEDRIEAWANGPVIPNLYELHKGRYQLEKDEIAGGDIRNLTKEEKTTIDSVIKYYCKFSGGDLSELTHKEKPWKRARRGYEPGDHCNVEITKESMATYYSSLVSNG